MGGRDMITDILNNERFQGNIHQIKWLTDFMDNWFVMLITTCAFAIISLAMLRNVFAGVYCSFPKFMDKVHEAHQLTYADLGNKFRQASAWGKVQTAGGIIYKILPDIKELTDFAEVPVEPKSYWVKAVPQMFMVVMIGGFIYNGYYRDTASLVANFGSKLFSNFIANVRPGDIVDNLFKSTWSPVYANSGNNSEEGRMIVDITKNSFNVLKDIYTDIIDKKDDWATVVSGLESVITTKVGEVYADVTSAVYGSADPDKLAKMKDPSLWTYVATVTRVYTNPQQLLEQARANKKSADGKYAQGVFALRIADYPTGSNITVGADEYLFVRIQFERKGTEKPTEASFVGKLTAHLDTSNGTVSIHGSRIKLISGSVDNTTDPTANEHYRLKVTATTAEINSKAKTDTAFNGTNIPAVRPLRLKGNISATYVTDENKTVKFTITEIILSDAPGNTLELLNHNGKTINWDATSQEIDTIIKELTNAE